VDADAWIKGMDTDSLKNERHKLSTEYNFKRSKLTKQINKIRRVECKEFRKQHKALFLTFDCIIVMLILFNFGALFITNAMVVKSTPEKQFQEANPIAAEIHDYEPHPEGKTFINTIVFFIFIWSLLTFAYVVVRNKVSNDRTLYPLLFVIIFYLLALTTDFVNNLGFYIGTKLWGL